MADNLKSYKIRHNLLGFFGTCIGGIALILTIIHFYAGSVENKVEKTSSFKQMAINLFKGSEKKEIKPSFNIQTDKNLKILSGFLACIGIILAALSHLKNETKNAYLSAAYLSVGAIGFQILTHSLVMLIGFILMVFLFTKFNFIKN